MQTSNTARPTVLGLIAAVWGLAGFFFLVGGAMMRLAALSLDAFSYTLTPLQWILLVANVIFMAYSEGYKGFQKHYSPRLAARAKYLAYNGHGIELILAPLFCMNFLNAPRKRIITSVVLLIGIIILVLLFRFLPQPWRGILDAGVVVGLTWGLLASVWFCLQAIFDRDFDVDPEVVR